MTGAQGAHRATAYLAPTGLLDQLRSELAERTSITAVHGDLIVTAGPPKRAVWAQNIWYDPELLRGNSVGDLAAQLKAIQRNWWPYAFQLHRRTALLVDKLPHVGAKPLVFPAPAPTAPLGAFTLLSPDTVLAAPRCSSPFPNGEPAFEEYKVGPPSRAYLKLFEAFTRLGRRPLPGSRCLELGASPGGWTWVLARLGCQVVAYDRAPLDSGLAQTPGITSVKGDAFTATPERVGPIDWLLSDVICYPEKLLAHVRLWLAAGTCRNFLCTLKFQGDAHYGVIDEFLAIPGSQLMHLFNNKHELTWALIRPD